MRCTRVTVVWAGVRLALLGLAFAPLAQGAEALAFTNTVGMTLVRVAPGSFTRGQAGPVTDCAARKHPAEVDRADWDEQPAHAVTLTKAFYLAATEVTLSQYRLLDPDFRKDGDATPGDSAVHGISWTRASAYCAWLSAREGRPYRLPTEAEWEYACRAGAATLFSTGDTLPAGYQPWFRDVSRRDLYFGDGAMPPEYRWLNVPASLRVAQRPPNAWGLYDMHGNLAEWCLDWYGPYEAGAQTDPAGRRRGDFRVFRGGSHSALVRQLRSANRGAWLPDSACKTIGFRVALAEPPSAESLRPPPPPALNAQDVSPAAPPAAPAPADAPVFAGPAPYVVIPPGACGPLFIGHNHSPALAECPNGDLLAVWYSCVEEPGPELCNAASRLRRGASAWEPASPFWDGPDVNDHAPKLWWDGERTLYHFARGLAENIVRTSTDSGATWSKAALVQPCDEFGNAPTRTREGFIIMTHDSGASSLLISRDNGKTWASTDAKRGPSDVRPGGRGFRHAGIHAPVAQLADGRLMTVGRFDDTNMQARFSFKTPVSYSADLGETWTYEASEFPAISSVQRAVLMRLREGPLLLCTYTDQARDWNARKGLDFQAADGRTFKGYGLFAAVSLDDGKTWPCRRLVTPGGPEKGLPSIDRNIATFSDTIAERCGYLAAVQARDGRIHLISSKNHYVFNLAWLKQRPALPAGR